MGVKRFELVKFYGAFWVFPCVCVCVGGVVKRKRHFKFNARLLWKQVKPSETGEALSQTEVCTNKRSSFRMSTSDYNVITVRTKTRPLGKTCIPRFVRLNRPVDSPTQPAHIKYYANRGRTHHITLESLRAAHVKCKCKYQSPKTRPTPEQCCAYEMCVDMSQLTCCRFRCATHRKEW